MKIENKQLISNIFNSIKNIAIVGASLDMEKPSNEVMEYCKKFDYKIFPVNPKYSGKNMNAISVFTEIGFCEIPLTRCCPSINHSGLRSSKLS